MKTPSRGLATASPRHPAFVTAIRLELADYKNVLEFTAEHQLTTEPLRIDVLIIKKPPEVVIEKNIAAIFRSVNIVEYKSPSKHVSVADFYKVHAYAYLYASLEKTAITDSTLTIVESHYPHDLIRHIKEFLHFGIEENTPGIYTVVGDVLPVQIIDSRKLSPDENVWLKNLRRNLGVVEAHRMTKEMSQTKGLGQDGVNVGPYLEAIFKANTAVFREALKMSNGTLTMDQVLEEVGLTAKWEARGEAKGEVRGEARGKYEVARNALNEGFSVDSIQRITGLPLETINKLAVEGK
ncbi:hypothetical protein FACS1894147_03120 [Spirochaetia bacterium]|nr:hypothetical protein FACS1894147_03120 [Spirochaetia bacterium]